MNAIQKYYEIFSNFAHLKKQTNKATAQRESNATNIKSMNNKINVLLCACDWDVLHILHTLRSFLVQIYLFCYYCINCVKELANSELLSPIRTFTHIFQKYYFVSFILNATKVNAFNGTEISPCSHFYPISVLHFAIVNGKQYWNYIMLSKWPFNFQFSSKTKRGKCGTFHKSIIEVLIILLTMRCKAKQHWTKTRTRSLWMILFRVNRLLSMLSRINGWLNVKRKREWQCFVDRKSIIIMKVGTKRISKSRIGSCKF